MNEDIVIKIDGVSKKFARNLKKSMVYGLRDIVSNMFGRSSKSDQLRAEEFWAVDDVSFDVKKGETIGLIGPNGSGKTTLLKMLNGIFWPDKGEISIRGKVGALIAVGAGFHPMLTGRENIYANAAILGMNRRQVEAQFDEIIEFADIGDFLDTPVKNYSSGMFVRLGFAIAVHCDPDVLLIDEVLAVGDQGFRSKCYEKIAELKEKCTVVFVSHDMDAIARICDRVVVCNKSVMEFCGKTDDAIEYYQNLFITGKSKTQSFGTGEAEIHDFKICNNEGQELETIEYGKDVQFNFNVNVDRKYEDFVVIVSIAGRNRQIIAQCHSGTQGIVFKNSGDVNNIAINIDKLPVKPGKYYIDIAILDRKSNLRHLAWFTRFKEFEVTGKYVPGATVQLISHWGA